MTLPQLMFRIWDGVGHNGRQEFFTWQDMNRCEYNANIIATEAGVPTVQFASVTRASQFMYDEMQLLENLTATIATEVGATIGSIPTWAAGRGLTFVDFERVESNLYACYQALGGVGERVQSHQFLITAHATLFASSWQGDGPYHIDLTMPAIHPDREAIAYVDHNATAEQHMAAYNAMLRAMVYSDRTVRIYADSIRPSVNIPIKVTIGLMDMIENITLSASGWAGSGPYTQTVTLPNAESVADAIIGPSDSTTSAMAVEMARCGIVVSGLSGTSMTVTALFSQPEINLTAGVLFNQDEVAE